MTDHVLESRILQLCFCNAADPMDRRPLSGVRVVICVRCVRCVGGVRGATSVREDILRKNRLSFGHCPPKVTFVPPILDNRENKIL